MFFLGSVDFKPPVVKRVQGCRYPDYHSKSQSRKIIEGGGGGSRPIQVSLVPVLEFIS